MSDSRAGSEKRPTSGPEPTSEKVVKRPKRPAIRTAGILTRRDSKDASRTAIELAEWLARRTVTPYVSEKVLDSSDLSDDHLFRFERRYDLVIVLGGDGTLLSAARAVAPGVPLFGVNLGRLGFLTEVGRHELYPSLVQILAGAYTLQERSMFDVELRRRGRKIVSYRAFNDAVIAKKAPAQIIELEINVNQHLIANYRGDGLIIATPNGSTAYSLSAGGPILYPTLGVAIVTPICPHSLTMRPIVVPDTEAIQVELVSDTLEVVLTVDGQEEYLAAPRDVVVVKRSASSANLVRLNDRTFYDSLRHKLKWGS